MGKETRTLYIIIIILTLSLVFLFQRKNSADKKEAFSNGVTKGKYIQLQEFKNLYLPATPDDIQSPLQ